MAFFGAMAGRVFDWLPQAIISPWPLFLAIVIPLIARRRAIERQILGRCRAPFWREVAVEAVTGIAAGFVGSFLLLYLGITLNTEGFSYILFLAVLLMLLDLRYLCFAYAGGLLSLCSLLTGLPRLHVPSLLALVAILHITESLLILIDGDRRALPVYLHRPEGTVGGYLLQRVWPMPLICLGMVKATSQALVAYQQYPPWWPLIPQELARNPASGLIFLALPAAVALGYGDLALTAPPRETAKRTAGMLGVYSLTLLVLAVLSVRWRVFAWSAALFAPIGHELVLFAARWIEMHGRPAFTEKGEGAVVLAVLPDSHAEQAGFRPGQVIVGVNGQPVRGKVEFLSCLDESPARALVDIASPGGVGTIRRELRGGSGGCGLLLAPDLHEPAQIKIPPWRFLPTRRGSL